MLYSDVFDGIPKDGCETGQGRSLLARRSGDRPSVSPRSRSLLERVRYERVTFAATLHLCIWIPGGHHQPGEAKNVCKQTDCRYETTEKRGRTPKRNDVGN